MSSNDFSPKASTRPQHLPPEGAYHCDRCKRLVIFRVVRTQQVRADPRKRYAYLVCPECGARATQIRWKRMARSLASGVQRQDGRNGER